jgi:hypothetical protein
MTSRAGTSRSRPSAIQAPAAQERRPPPILSGALGSGLVAALCLVLGALVPVVSGAKPGFTSAPLLIVLALVPIGVAAGFTLAGRHTAAAGLLLGLAALAPGRLVLDLQFVADSSVVARPELYLPTALERPGAGAGLWLLVLGHLLTLAAGLFAMRFIRQQAESAGRGLPGRRRWQVIAPFAGVIGAIGLFLLPLRSQSVYLLAVSPFDGPFCVWLGHLLLICALPLAALVAVGSSVDGVARGALPGLAFATFAVSLPDLIAGASVPLLQVALGPFVVVFAGLVLLGLSFLRPGAVVAEGDDSDSAESTDLAGEAVVPGLSRLRLASACLGLLTAVAALCGSLFPQVSSPDGSPGPESPARWLLLLAGVIVGVLAVLTAVPSVSSRIRPVLSVAWVGVELAGAAVLGTALTATAFMSSYTEGSGVLWTVAAMVLAGVTAGGSVILGVVEREESDDSGPDGPRPSGAVVTPLTAGAVLAVAAFGVATFAAPDYVAPGLWSNFSTPSWGILAALLTVLGAAALVPRSRPSQAAGLLGGAVLVLALRAAELPMLGGRIEGAHTALGFWLALAGIAALVIAAVMALTGARKPA